jgi:hypothetical protein
MVELAGAETLVDRARTHLDAGRPLHAIHLAELVPEDHPGARDVLRAAHQELLAASTNFWETAWLKQRIASNS